MGDKTTQKRQTTTQKAILNYPKEHPKATRQKENVKTNNAKVELTNSTSPLHGRQRSYRSLRDEQFDCVGRSPLGGDLCGVTGGVHGGVESGERGGRYGGVCEVYWSVDLRATF